MDEPTNLLSSYEDVSRNNGDPIIKLAFFGEDPDLGWFGKKWSRFGAWLTEQYVDNSERYYTHVEVRFSRGQVSSVNQVHGKVYMVDEKMLSRSGYSCFFQTVISRDQQDIIEKIARQYTANETPFNLKGLLCNFTPGFRHCMGTNQHGKKVFCSEYIVILLQSIGMFDDLNAYETSPSDLYKKVRNSPMWKLSYNRELSAVRLKNI
jgi:hypothetical protein